MCAYGLFGSRIPGTSLQLWYRIERQALSPAGNRLLVKPQKKSPIANTFHPATQDHELKIGPNVGSNICRAGGNADLTTHLPNLLVGGKVSRWRKWYLKISFESAERIQSLSGSQEHSGNLRLVDRYVHVWQFLLSDLMCDFCADKVLSNKHSRRFLLI